MIFMTPNLNVNFLNALFLIFKPKQNFDFLSKITGCRSSDHFTPPTPYQTAPSSIPTKLGLIVSYKKEINVEVSSKLTSHCHSLLCSFCRCKTLRCTAVALAITADVYNHGQYDRWRYHHSLPSCSVGRPGLDTRDTHVAALLLHES